MYLGEPPAAVPSKDEIAKVKSLPWITLYTPSQGIVPGQDPYFQTRQGYIPGKGVALAGAFGPGQQVARANGYDGPFLTNGITEVLEGEGAPIERVQAAPHPDLLAWLKAKGYTVKVAFPQSGQKTGFNYTSLWKGNTLVGVNSVAWSNKPGVMGYLTLGLLAVIAGGAALTGAGVIGGGAGTGAGAGSAGAGAGAAGAGAGAAGGAGASGAAATTATTAATTSAVSSILPTAAKLAPTVIGTVAKAAQAKQQAKTQAAAKKEAELQIQRQQEQYRQAMVAETLTRPAYDSSIFAPKKSTPNLFPILAIAAGGGLLFLMMGRKKR